MTTIAEAALDYATRRKWKPVPVSRKTKKPIGKEWQKRPFNPNQFNGNSQNVGIQCGEVSGGLVDVDLDARSAIGLAPEFLPATGAVFGRRSKPCSHQLYVSDLCKTESRAVIQYRQYLNGQAGAMIVELRIGGNGKGAHTVVPPSMHETGEVVEWVRDGEPMRVAGDELVRTVRKLAVASLLSTHYPGQGSRHDGALVIGGVLARAGWKANDIGHVVEVAARAAGDDDVPDRVTAAASAVNRKANGHDVAGFDRLREVWGDEVADTLKHWLKLPRADGPVFDPWKRYIVPTFPLDILPQDAQDYVRSQAVVIGCDISGMAMSVLGTFSGALHHRFALKMLRHGTWYEGPRLWPLMVGDPSLRKTPMFNAATRPLVQHEMHLQKIYDAALQTYQQAKEQGGGKTSLPRPNLPTRYVVWDTTTEKCGELLSRSPKGIFVLSDEISGWLGAMDKYHNKGGRHDRAFWLKAYDGGPFRYDRITRGELFIENLSVSLLGGIQPELLAQTQGLASDGLLQRFLPTMLGAASLAQDCPCDGDKYDALVRELIFAKPARLIMDDAALAVMTDLRRHLFELEQTSGGLAAGFQTFVGKLHGTAGRLALILHMAHDPQHGATYPVGEQTVANVRRLMLDFILPHGFEFYQQAGGGSERLRRLASWILTSHKQRVVSSDITTNVADFRGLTLPQVQEGVSPLVAGGWLEPESLAPSCHAWKVAPQVHTQLAERAKTELERKTKLAALMKLAMTGAHT